MIPESERTRSTAVARRQEVLDAGLRTFAHSGYQATPVSAVAATAHISQGYVLRLFTSKLQLFVAVLDHCYERILETLTRAADEVAGQPAETILEAMGDAYAALISDRALLMLQVHAQSSSDVPEIRDTMRRGLRSIVELAQDRSAGSPEQVQRFVAYGQLCHLIVTARLDNAWGAWSRTLTLGMTEVPASTPRGSTL